MIIDRYELCTNINCDKGKVITSRVTEEGRFELDDCSECKGRGFRLKRVVRRSKKHKAE